jgi:hypothetical protein
MHLRREKDKGWNQSTNPVCFSPTLDMSRRRWIKDGIKR